MPSKLPLDRQRISCTECHPENNNERHHYLPLSVIIIVIVRHICRRHHCHSHYHIALQRSTTFRPERHRKYIIYIYTHYTVTFWLLIYPGSNWVGWQWMLYTYYTHAKHIIQSTLNWIMFSQDIIHCWVLIIRAFSAYPYALFSLPRQVHIIYASFRILTESLQDPIGYHHV